MDAHVEQLRAALRTPETAVLEAERFVRRFIRPFGIGEPGTPRLAEAITAIGQAGRAPARESAGALLLRPWMAVLAMAALLGESIGARRPPVRRAVYEARFQTSRTARILQKRLLVHPARAASRRAGAVARQARRSTRAASRRAGAVVRQARRTTRAASRRAGAVARQARRTTRVARRAARSATQALLRLVRWPSVRLLRLGRQARYSAAMRLRRLRSSTSRNESTR
jgi:hypothetical protein